MPGKKQYYYYVNVRLNAKDRARSYKSRITKIRASSPVKAIANTCLKLKDLGLDDIKSIEVTEYDPKQPVSVPKDKVYSERWLDSDRYYEHNKTGKRLSPEAYKALPDEILP